ncbi:MAG: AMP-binding protein, partial [Chloroflexi bacterium]|nr:AMP-binding protein [Chloroflexota bacterium]
MLFRRVHQQLGGALHFVMSGGAYLDPELGRQWEALGVRVLEGYGTTEASPIISCNSFAHARLGTLGRPLPGVQVQVASDGEVLVRGPNVTPGYWQDTAATEASFAGGWYKTGDLGEIDGDGYLHFKGRKKDLIVLASGMNVYPEDIEALLRRQPSVADTVVVGLPRGGQGVEVHAALILKDAAASARDIVDEVNGALADHQRIQGFTVWPEEDFPRTHTLKVKKHEVIQTLARRGQEIPTQQTAGAHDVGVSPLFHLASRVAQKPLSGLSLASQLAADLGLDSLGRVELLSVVETEMGVYLDESQVTGVMTLGELEGLVQQGARQAAQVRYPDWPLHSLVRPLRALAQAGLFGTALSWFAPAKVEGRERLLGLQGPALFACNHQSHADTPVILAALPRRWRKRMTVAAAADHWFREGRVAGAAAAFLFNAFPFSRTDSIRPSLEHCSRLLDRGWSVLIYPEGTRSPDGTMGQFKS